MGSLQMNLDDLNEFEQWAVVQDGSNFVAELQRELPKSHVLSGVPVAAVARRGDRDDVLFVTRQSPSQLALVHLTWSMETDPAFPHTTLYQTWQEFLEDCRRDPF